VRIRSPLCPNFISLTSKPKRARPRMPPWHGRTRHPAQDASAAVAPLVSETPSAPTNQWSMPVQAHQAQRMPRTVLGRPKAKDAEVSRVEPRPADQTAVRAAASKILVIGPLSGTRAEVTTRSSVGIGGSHPGDVQDGSPSAAHDAARAECYALSDLGEQLFAVCWCHGDMAGEGA
jgi:hypothetical protein